MDAGKTELVERVEAQLRELVAAELGVEPEDVVREADFVADLAADSLDVVELIMKMEDRFSITIPDEDAEEIRTFGKAVDFVVLRISVEEGNA